MTTVMIWTVLVFAVFLGTCIQGALGFGMGTIAAPLIAILAPDLIPGVIITMGIGLTLPMTLRERRHLDVRGTGIALLGRVGGSFGGAMLVAEMSTSFLGCMVGLIVLVGLVLNLGGWRPPPSGRNLIIAGVTSGVCGTATSIGGPPMALIWQHETAARLRSSMSLFFLVGSLISVIALRVTGSFHLKQVLWALYLAPGVIAGLLASRVIIKYMSRDAMARTTIAVSAAAAMFAIIVNL